MNTLQLEKILADHLKSVYFGVCAEDQLPDTDVRPLAIIVNSDPSYEDGTHWSALYLFQNGTGEYFDSYGQPAEETVRNYLHIQAPLGWAYNTRLLQNLWSTVCGAYCVQYLEARHRKRDIPFSTLLRRLFPYRDSDKSDKLVQRRMKEHYGIKIPLVERRFWRSRIRDRRRSSVESLM
jgi:hypothetical protein